MRDHTKLRAFALADEITVMVYEATRRFPKDEVYGMTSQMRRAAVSVPSNIVEGCTRASQTDYMRFLEIAFGSLRELHYHCGLSKRLGYFEHGYDSLAEKLKEAEKVLGALIRTLRRSPGPGREPRL